MSTRRSTWQTNLDISNSTPFLLVSITIHLNIFKRLPTVRRLPLDFGQFRLIHRRTTKIVGLTRALLLFVVPSECFSEMTRTHYIIKAAVLCRLQSGSHTERPNMKIFTSIRSFPSNLGSCMDRIQVGLRSAGVDVWMRVNFQ